MYDLAKQYYGHFVRNVLNSLLIIAAYIHLVLKYWAFTLKEVIVYRCLLSN